ncbi:hypothetical protein ABID16_003379 [Rhizobium aquaticum]|uniref:Uncharacterized protein n=2 Tax=Rhizobium aquaticum TaxID=1549636 RepID=A0ABV2J2R5_9HYPH
MTEQPPRREEPQGNTPRGYLKAKGNPESDRDALEEKLRDPRRKNLG